MTSSSSRWTRLISKLGTRSGKLGVAAFIVTFAVLASAGAGYAYWSASVAATGTLSAADLSLTASNFGSAGYTFRNDSLSTTGSVTVTNSTASASTTTGAVSITFGPGDSGSLAGKVTLTLWPTTDASTCTTSATVPSGATTALWSATTALSATLAPAAAAIYCLRSTIASRESVATSSGTIGFTPKITATITLSNFSGATSATATQSTQYIYLADTSKSSSTWNWIRPNFTPNGQNLCADVLGSFTASGTQVISFPCSNPGSPNELWKFTEVGTTGYYTITPKNAPLLRLDNQSTNTADSILVSTAAANPATAPNQLWQLQINPSGGFQIVNAYNGYCLNPATSGGHYSQFPCNGQATQQYFVSPAFDNFKCAISGANYAWSWTSATGGPYHLKITSGGTTTEYLATAATASGATLPFSATAALANGTYAVSFVDANGTTVSYGSITETTNNATNACTATALTP